MEFQISLLVVRRGQMVQGMQGYGSIKYIRLEGQVGYIRHNVQPFGAQPFTGERAGPCVQPRAQGVTVPEARPARTCCARSVERSIPRTMRGAHGVADRAGRRKT